MSDAMAALEARVAELERAAGIRRAPLVETLGGAVEAPAADGGLAVAEAREVDGAALPAPGDQAGDSLAGVAEA